MSKTPFWETVVILLGIVALWPAYILRLPGWHWKAFAYVMLGLLAIVFVRRLRRVKSSFEQPRNNGKPPA
jgi:membrane protein implicated in regulation of membrane protease activity